MPKWPPNDVAWNSVNKTGMSKLSWFNQILPWYRIRPSDNWYPGWASGLANNCANFSWKMGLSCNDCRSSLCGPLWVCPLEIESHRRYSRSYSCIESRSHSPTTWPDNIVALVFGWPESYGPLDFRDQFVWRICGPIVIDAICRWLSSWCVTRKHMWRISTISLWIAC